MRLMINKSMKNIYIIGLLWACSGLAVAETATNSQLNNPFGLQVILMLYVLLRALKLWDYGEWKFQIIRNVWNIITFVVVMM